MNPRDFIKVIREQIERLGEISPPVADDIISQFRKEFDGKYPNVSKPEITNGLVEIKVYKEPPVFNREKATQTDITPNEQNLFREYKEPGSSIDTENASVVDSIATLQTVTPVARKMTRKAAAWK
jgi:hypothetical protein